MAPIPRTRAQEQLFLFFLRGHGAGSVSAPSQQLSRRPVPGLWDTSWDSPASRCPSVWGGEEVPASAHSNQQVKWGVRRRREAGGSGQHWSNAQKLTVNSSPPSPAPGNFFERRSCSQPLCPPSPTPSLSSAVLLHRAPFLGGPPVQGGCSLETRAAPM